MTLIQSVNPATAAVEEAVVEETTPADLDDVVARATAAAAPLRRRGRSFRARLLRAIADRLEQQRDEIVRLGMRETALAQGRLDGELTRTCYQARLFADVVEEGSFLEAAIDHAKSTPMGPGPDLRRMLVPLGPVAVFGASNFPLAFSVPGGDTMSALAAGCPVVVKAHSSHPALSLLTFRTMQAAAASVGAPEGTLGIVFGQRAGAGLVSAPPIRAVAFTGSLNGGRALLELINARAEPIPFFGELSSINPVVISAGALAERAEQVAEGLVTSVTGSGGQLCTKPGVVLVPHGIEGDRFLADVAGRIARTAAFTLLNGRIADSYEQSLADMEQDASHTVLSLAEDPRAAGFTVPAALVEVGLHHLLDHGIDETFGPLAVVVRYRGNEVLQAVGRLEGSLTLTVHSEPHEVDLLRELADVGLPKVGRLIHNAWPTGVLVSWAQTHGGPWPSTNTQHTSVGTSAVRRFMRPVTWQSVPPEVLPVELTDDYDQIPRRIDGRFVLGTAREH